MTNKEIIALLKSIEWFCIGYKTYSCFVCKQLEENGHTEDCALGQAITALKAEPKVNLWFVRDYLKSALNRWGLDDAKYWVEQALCELERPKCETCGGEKVIIDEKKGQQITSGGVTLSNLIPCPDCPPKDEAIKEAMEAVEQRREGRYKLVYDKPSRTIVAVPNPNYSPCDCEQPKAEGDNRRLEVLRFNRNELFQETIKLKVELAKAKERIEAYEKRPAAIKCPKCKTIIKVV